MIQKNKNPKSYVDVTDHDSDISWLILACRHALPEARPLPRHFQICWNHPVIGLSLACQASRKSHSNTQIYL